MPGMRHAKRILRVELPWNHCSPKIHSRRFFYRYSVNGETNQIRHLFWEYPDTTVFYKHHCDILILDCLYKANRYNIPLLNIIAMTGLNTALTVAQC